MKLYLQTPKYEFCIIFAYHEISLFYFFQPFKIIKAALAGVAQWIEHWPVNQRVAGSMPSQGTLLGCRPGPH